MARSSPIIIIINLYSLSLFTCVCVYLYYLYMKGVNQRKRGEYNNKIIEEAEQQPFDRSRLIIKSKMDDVFHLIKLGDGLAVRLWLDSIENDFNQW